MVHGEAPESAAALHEEFKSYFVDNFEYTKKTNNTRTTSPSDTDDADDGSNRRAYKRYMQLIDEFVAFFNGFYSDRGQLVHHCSGPACCSGLLSLTEQHKRKRNRKPSNEQCGQMQKAQTSNTERS